MSNLGLETDVGNSNFVGARNPDDLMSVDFFMGELIDKWSTEDPDKNPTGKTIKFPPQPCVRICTPGQANLNLIERPVIEADKMRWPQKWMYFATKNGIIDGEVDIPGWKIADWDELKDDPELVRELEFKRFVTVEQLAGASDAQIQRIGMVGIRLREKAKKALATHINAATKEAIAERDQRIADLEAKLNRLMEVVDKPKVGRPKKEDPE